MSSHSQPIRIGLIGAGANTSLKHIPLLLKQPNVQLVSVCNRSIESSTKIANQWKIGKVAQNWTDICKDPEVDAVMIGTWPYMHYSMIKSALENGKHVLCEARMAMNAQQARELLELSQSRPNLVTQIVPSPLTLKFDNTIRSLVKQLGDILHIDLQANTGNFQDKTSTLTWRQDIDKSGLNIQMMGIYYEALMRWVGPAKSVFALSKVFTKMRPDETGFLTAVQVPDHLDLLLDMHCGAQARLQFSSVLGLRPANSAIIYGSKGTINYHIDEQKLFFGTSENNELKEVTNLIDPQEWRVEEEFISSIRKLEKVKLTDFTTGLHYMEFTEAVTTSLNERRLISISPYASK